MEKTQLLTVISRTYGGRAIALCSCACGNKVEVSLSHVVSGHTRSCGCMKIARLVAMNKTHGMTKTPEYKAWQEARNRCNNQNCRTWKHYGGRGIRVCSQWSKFENFFADMGCRPSAKHSLDRIDVDGHYEPSNCRWATSSEQQGNRRDTTKFMYMGEVMSLSKLARVKGIPQSTLQRWLIQKGIEMDGIKRVSFRC